MPERKNQDAVAVASFLSQGTGAPVKAPAWELEILIPQSSRRCTTSLPCPENTQQSVPEEFDNFRNIVGRRKDVVADRVCLVAIQEPSEVVCGTMRESCFDDSSHRGGIGAHRGMPILRALPVLMCSRHPKWLTAFAPTVCPCWVCIYPCTIRWRVPTWLVRVAGHHGTVFHCLTRPRRRGCATPSSRVALTP